MFITIEPVGTQKASMRMNYDGIGFRAAVAFGVLNLILLVTVVIAIVIAPFTGQTLWLQAVLALLFVAGEAAVVAQTIGPPLREWISNGRLTKRVV